MVKNKFTTALVIAFITLEFFKVGEIQAENINAKLSSKPLRTFNSFSVSSWFNIPSQFMQYWFPLFGSSYYPSHLQKPNATKIPQSTGTVTNPGSTTTIQTSTNSPSTVSQNQTDKTTENSKPKTNNIFGFSGSSGDRIEYLPSPNEIEWYDELHRSAYLQSECVTGFYNLKPLNIFIDIDITIVTLNLKDCTPCRIDVTSN